MAVVMFIGDGRSDPAVLTMFGLTFPLCEPVEVADMDYPEALWKLRRNGHFVVSDLALDVFLRLTDPSDALGPPEPEGVAGVEDL
jgi:hypothetical protein